MFKTCSSNQTTNPETTNPQFFSKYTVCFVYFDSQTKVVSMKKNSGFIDSRLCVWWASYV